MDFKKRIEKFFDFNKKTKWVLIFNSRYPFLDKNFLYFTNFEEEDFENCGLLFSKNRKILFVNKMEMEKVKKFETIVFNSKEDFFKKVKEIVKNEFVGLNCSFLSYNFIKNLIRFKIKFKDVSKELEAIRKIKDKKEIKRIRKSSKITCKIFDEILKEIRKGISEAYLKKMILKILAERNCKPAFEPIVAFGKNTAIPHYFISKDNKLNKNSPILIDFGANYKNYVCDFTRTIHFGKPKAFFKQIYEKVKNAEKVCIKKAKAGFAIKNFYEDIFKIFGKYKENFLHSLGHEVGLEIHEGDVLSYNNKSKLKENMVIAIEPALYFNKQFGIRIEDTILIKNKKSEILTKYTKELIEL